MADLNKQSDHKLSHAEHKQSHAGHETDNQNVKEPEQQVGTKKDNNEDVPLSSSEIETAKQSNQSKEPKDEQNEEDILFLDRSMASEDMNSEISNDNP